MISTQVFQELFSQLWFRFLLVAVFGFLTGLEFRAYGLQQKKRQPNETEIRLGSSRTFTFVAILGFVLFSLDAQYRIYLAGYVGLIIFFAQFYHHKLTQGSNGLLQLLILMIVYSYGAVVNLLPPWFLVLLFVSVVFTLSARPLSQRLSESLDPQEIGTLAKFLLLSGVILPLLPNQTISPYIPATPFKIWLAVVIISAISYAGYILKKYLLRQQGYLVTGLLGGLYSSTATTVVLARKTQGLSATDASLNAGIIAASGMMYLRLMLLIAIMNWPLLTYAALPLFIFALISIGLAIMIDKRGEAEAEVISDLSKSNPLELGIAFLFAALFVIMMMITQQVVGHFGGNGLNLLSLGVGFTDIDPFVLSILSGHYQGMSLQQLAGAIIVAAGSNNLLKAVYAFMLGKRQFTRSVSLFLLLLGLITIGCGFLLPQLFH